MNEEDKNLLMLDLSCRLPYSVECEIRYFEDGEELSCDDVLTKLDIECGWLCFEQYEEAVDVDDVRPYLRRMSSMTDSEKIEFDKLMNVVEERCVNAYGKGGYSLAFVELNDWLNKNHFDYRGLLDKGLAIEMI